MKETMFISFRESKTVVAVIDSFCQVASISRSDFIRVALRKAIGTKLENSESGQNERKVLPSREEKHAQEP